MSYVTKSGGIFPKRCAVKNARRSGRRLILQRINALWKIYKNSVCTSQETHYVAGINIERFNVFRESLAVYCDHTKYINTLCGQNAEL
jgi:hypothetical protein